MLCRSDMIQQPINTELYVALTPAALACPSSVEELDELLRMHVPESQILQDVQMRPLNRPLDEAGERRLLEGGASLSLIRQLRAMLQRPVGC